MHDSRNWPCGATETVVKRQEISDVSMPDNSQDVVAMARPVRWDAVAVLSYLMQVGHLARSKICSQLTGHRRRLMQAQRRQVRWKLNVGVLRWRSLSKAVGEISVEYHKQNSDSRGKLKKYRKREAQVFWGPEMVWSNQKSTFDWEVIRRQGLINAPNPNFNVSFRI
jgi:hypothetical protein